MKSEKPPPPAEGQDLFTREEVEKALSILMSPDEVQEAMEFIYETAGGLGYVGLSDNFFDAVATLSEDAARRVKQYREEGSNRRPAPPESDKTTN